MLHGYFDIPTFHYFEEKNTWSGSNYTNFSYRIDPILGDEKELYVRVWKTILSFSVPTVMVSL